MGKNAARALSALILCFAMFAAGAGPGAAVTVPSPVGDRPVLVPGTPYPDTNDDGSLAASAESAFIDDVTAGDTPLSVEQASLHRSQAAGKVKAINTGAATFNGAWAPLGPGPIGQLQRTTGALTAESGRIGALAILPTGRFILAAAQGGIWTRVPRTGQWVPQTGTLPT